MSAPRRAHQPIRSCVVCRERAPQPTLIRFAHVASGYQLDTARTIGGRGSWVCSACASEANEKRFKRAFKQHTSTVLEQLTTQQPATRATEMEA